MQTYNPDTGAYRCEKTVDPDARISFTCIGSGTNFATKSGAEFVKNQLEQGIIEVWAYNPTYDRLKVREHMGQWVVAKFALDLDESDEVKWLWDGDLVF